MNEAIEHFEERAAVIEYDGKEKRIHAESLALREIAPKYGSNMNGVMARASAVSSAGAAGQPRDARKRRRAGAALSAIRRASTGRRRRGRREIRICLQRH